MFWVVIAILVVGYFIVQALNRSNASHPPIEQRIKMVKELDDSLQSYLGTSLKNDLEEYKRLRHHKDERYAWKTWNKELEEAQQNNYDDFCRLVEINSRLCQRFTHDEQRLLDQLTDWGIYMEQMRDGYMENDIDAYIDATLDLPKIDEVAMAERSGIMQETYKRMMERAKNEGILEARLKPSTTRNLKD